MSEDLEKRTDKGDYTEEDFQADLEIIRGILGEETYQQVEGYLYRIYGRTPPTKSS